MATQTDRACQELNWPNRITILRVILTIFFVVALLYFTPERAELYYWALGFFFSACISDGLDGFLARRLKQTTEFGAILDPVADKLLLISGFLSLSLMEHLPEAMRVPAWVTLPILARDLVLLIGAVIIFMLTGSLKIRPIYIGKVTTVLQMLTLAASLLMAPATLRIILYVVAVLMTAISASLYVSRGGRIMQDA